MSGNSQVAETWDIVYQAFQDVNFTAWDFDSIKKSLLDYLKLYYPEESFNDYIESSELIAQVEIFAYIAELFAYRLDLNAHESVLSQADRKDSILKLASALSYNASRNLAARGLVKISSISTTQVIYDSYGNNLANKTILWADANNPLWKDQFITIMNAVLAQNFGTLPPSDIVQVENILFELYDFNNNPITNNVLSYVATVSSQPYAMNIVSSDLNEYGPYERRPQNGMSLSCLYLNDGLGDSSPYTGFFFFTKQGTLTRTVTTFDGVTPNQTFSVNINNINNTDVWVNNIDPTTGNILTSNGIESGKWYPVDVSDGQNIVFNTNQNFNKYQINTLANDQIELIFGDGNFANIPGGTFEIWTRASANTDIVFPTNSIQNVSLNFQYNDTNLNLQTFNFFVSLTSPLQNAASSESIEHIRRIAPAYYYSQGRMVNGQDYNTFPLQDNSILKINAVNRTFAGDSKYIAWNDPSGYYQNVKTFLDDGVIYFDNYLNQQSVALTSLPSPDYNTNVATSTALLNNYIQPLVDSQEFSITMIFDGLAPANVRTIFSSNETQRILSAISQIINSPPMTVWLSYSASNNAWTVSTTSTTNYQISISFQNNNYFLITFNGVRIIIHSGSINFWVNNYNDKTINYQTLDSMYDKIVVLSANMGSSNNIVGFNYPINIVAPYVYTVGPQAGQTSSNDLIGIPNDLYGDGVPIYTNLSFLINQNMYVYFNRTSTSGAPWTYVPYSQATYASWLADQEANTNLWKRCLGAENLNLLWLHIAPEYNLIDPAPSNIIDMYIMTRGYYTLVQQWLTGLIASTPVPPTPFQLRSDYSYLLESKMISDDVILHSGKIKIIFGPLADQNLQAVIQVVPSPNTKLTNNQIKSQIVNYILNYFNINDWNFGETFYFTDLASYVTANMGTNISSIVLVPLYNGSVFGNLMQINANFDEIIQPNITTSQIQIVTSIDPLSLSLL